MPTSSTKNAKQKAVALSNRDIANKLDIVTVHLTNNNPTKALQEYTLLKQQVAELGLHLKTLCQNGK